MNGYTSFNILLVGESGTGKEAIAKLYLKSLGEYLVPINCAGKSWQNIYDDLFSAEKEERPLILKTKALLLDEIEKSQLDAQGGLLRLLDKPQGEIRLSRELTAIRWDGLVVATATESIYKKMKDDTFIKDLFWRFDIRVEISPLRNMRSKPDKFKELFVAALNIALVKFEVKSTPKLSEFQVESILSHKWYGNLRELLEMADNLACELALFEKRTTGSNYDSFPEVCFDRVFNRFSKFESLLEKG
ncbi:MAG: sigma 54-interacting transcriptional regulator [Nitrospirae bacterium]|nr:sigma 54-interacting transcriptional regulator [Nitrospirota bacterium]